MKDLVQSVERHRSHDVGAVGAENIPDRACCGGSHISFQRNRINTEPRQRPQIIAPGALLITEGGGNATRFPLSLFPTTHRDDENPSWVSRGFMRSHWSRFDRPKLEEADSICLEVRSGDRCQAVRKLSQSNRRAGRGPCPDKRPACQKSHERNHV